MVDVLYELGDFQITSLKVDKCNAPSAIFFFGILWVLAGFSVAASVFATLVNYHNWGFVPIVVAFIAMVIGTLGLPFILPERCGIKICLKENNKEPNGTDELYGSIFKEFQLSGNTAKDARKIQSIVVSFEQEIREELMRRERKAENKKRCCSQYKEVIEKVK